MEGHGTSGPQNPTFDDIRRLLECVNALHTTNADRPNVLAMRVVGLLGDVMAFVEAEVDGELKRLGVAASSAVSLPDFTPVIDPAADRAGPAVGSKHEVSLLTPTADAAPPQPAGIRSVLVRGKRRSILSAYRPQPFDARHVTLLKLLHPQVAWVFDAIAIHAGVPEVIKPVLELMLRGLPERDIAEKLGRSAHTVHGHIKKVYRHFDVNSRSALIARLYDSERANAVVMTEHD